MYIYDLDDPMARETLADLDDTSAAACVRILHLRPYVTSRQSRLEQKQVARRSRTWTDLKRRISVVRSKAGSGSKRAIQSLLGNLQNLNNLEYLDIQCHISDDIDAFQHTIPQIKASWPCYAACLRRLCLKVPLECFSALLSSPTLFPRLTDLSIYLFAAEYSTNPVEPMRSYLAPFINLHYKTLESLTMITPETGTVDLSPLFFDLRFFSRLVKLHLVFCALTLEYINLSGLHEFFSAHCNQVQEIVLHFNRMLGVKPGNFHAVTFFALPVFRVPFSKLKFLDLGFSGFKDSTGLATLSYVQMFHQSLEKLLLNHTQLSIGSVSRLANNFRQIHTMELCVYHLSPALIDCFSAKMKQLTDLRLTCISFSGSQGPFDSVDDPVRAHKFCAEMSRRMYVGWGLKNLRVQALSDKAKNLGLCKRALVTALPDLKALDGLPRSIYLADPDLASTKRKWVLSICDPDWT